MVNANITGAHPLCNHKGDGVSRLSHIFHALFAHYLRYKSPMVANLFYALRTVVGLGFTACLTDAAYNACYQPYLTCFLHYDRGDFQKHPDVLEILADGTANMIFLAAKSFQTHHSLTYYPAFINDLNYLLNNVIVTELGQSQAARQVLGMLQRKEVGNRSYFHP